MYEYFGVGPQVQEDVDGICPRFLRCLPKYRLSTPSKRSLEIWCMVIDNLIVADVIFFLVGSYILRVFVIWLWFGIFFHFGCFVIFRCLWILGLDVRSMLSVNGLWSWMVARCCLNVAMGGIGILAIGCWLRFNLNVLLRQFYFLLVPPFGWLTF